MWNLLLLLRQDEAKREGRVGLKVASHERIHQRLIRTNTFGGKCENRKKQFALSISWFIFKSKNFKIKFCFDLCQITAWCSWSKRQEKLSQEVVCLGTYHSGGRGSAQSKLYSFKISVWSSSIIFVYIECMFGCCCFVGDGLQGGWWRSR